MRVSLCQKFCPQRWPNSAPLLLIINVSNAVSYHLSSLRIVVVDVEVEVAVAEGVDVEGVDVEAADVEVVETNVVERFVIEDDASDVVVGKGNAKTAKGK